MPVAHFHLVNGAYPDAAVEDLLVRASIHYAEILESPIDRVRAFAVRYAPAAVAVAGRLVSEGAPPAPYFTAIVLAGRPVAEREALARRFTDLIVQCLDVDRALVRGQIIEVSPENWSIAGDLAIVARAAEVDARARARRDG